jgi:hypothetical protein
MDMAPAKERNISRIKIVNTIYFSRYHNNGQIMNHRYLNILRLKESCVMCKFLQPLITDMIFAGEHDVL